MPPAKKKPPPAAGTQSEYKTIAAQFVAAKRAKEAAEEGKSQRGGGVSGSGSGSGSANGASEGLLSPAERQQLEEARAKASALRIQQTRQRELLELLRKSRFERRWLWSVGFWVWMFCVHAAAILLFTSGFLLTRLVLDEKSSCVESPVLAPGAGGPDLLLLEDWKGRATVDGGCWHPSSFKRAVIVIIDALRYDFTVPMADDAEFHNAFPFLYETAAARPSHAFLRPFIADPPTATLQRLKGLTTGTLPTFFDLGSNFAGTDIDEDNLLAQLRSSGRRIAHLGDDTWTALFPGYFEPNISRAYDSFNVWDLHTVDNGVLEHIFPLMEAGRRAEWDVLIGHLLGVDHAGHRYGPAHREMTAKLRQMDGFIRELSATVDDDTLLVVMGDHGMDSKGDHGGESDDEVEAALWMFSSRPFFGRRRAEWEDGEGGEDTLLPPPNAKVRPVNQIDLVPTLSLLLGIPIPYNNLGHPIEEAFLGPKGDAYDRLAAASHVTAAGIKRYQASYLAARRMKKEAAEEADESSETSPQRPGSGSDATSPAALWRQAGSSIAEVGRARKTASRKKDLGRALRRTHSLFAAYQAETLLLCKALWARFDLPAMAMGIATMALALLLLLVYASHGGGVSGDDVADSDDDDDDDGSGVVLDDPELDLAERRLEMREAAVAAAGKMRGGGDGRWSAGPQELEKRLLTWALMGGASASGLRAVLLLMLKVGPASWQASVGATALCSLGAALFALVGGGRWRRRLSRVVPSTFWGWLSVLVVASQSAGFASNSYTIWEDSITLFLLGTFGLAAGVAAMRLPDVAPRALGVYHAVLFVLLGRLASFSKLCREEQMPHCASTYYSSAASSTSSPWQLAVPFVVALALPAVVRSYLAPTRSYEGLAPTWIGVVLRLALALSAVYWTLDAADNGGWLDGLLPGWLGLKSASVYTAQLTLGLSLVAGSTAFIWAPPSVSILSTAGAGAQAVQAAPSKPQITILGYGNAHGSRYLILPLNLLAALVLISKPMGGGALALMAWQALSLAELLDLLSLTGGGSSSSSSPSAVGPIVLALLASFHYFKTGHQATLASIQWDAAFVPLFTVRYPWSPLLVAFNHFAAHALAAAFLPLLVLWKSGPKRKGLLVGVGRAATGAFVAYFAAECLATMAWAAHLRRHLMLFRVFNPRFMMAAAVLLLVDLVAVAVGLVGFRSNSLAVADVFGWAE